MKYFIKIFIILCLHVSAVAQIQDYTTMASLRSETKLPKKNDKVFVKETQKLYYVDVNDTTTADDGANVLVQGNLRWKCIGCYSSSISENTDDELQSIGLDSIITSTSKTYSIKTTSPNDVTDLTRKIVVPIKNTNYVILNSNFTSSVNTNIPATSLSFNIVSGKSYLVKLVGNYESSNTTNGCRITFRSLNSTHNVVGSVYGSIGHTAVATELKAGLWTIAVPEGLFTTTAVGLVNVPTPLGAEFIITAASNDTITLHFGSEISTVSSTLRAGTLLVINQIN